VHPAFEQSFKGSENRAKSKEKRLFFFVLLSTFRNFAVVYDSYKRKVESVLRVAATTLSGGGEVARTSLLSHLR